MHRLSEFQILVRDELKRARRKFPSPESVPEGWTRHQLMHYWLGVIREEYLEFELEVFEQEIDVDSLVEELVQISAMCQRAAESCGLTRR